MSLSGSDHRRSHRRPQSGIYAKVSMAPSQGRDWSCRATHISRAHDAPDLLHRVQVRAQTAVHGEDLLVDDSGNRQAVEAIGERLPQLDVVSSLAFVVEPVDAVDAGAFVVATENEEVLGVLDLVCEEQADGFQRLLAAVDIVTEEEVVRFRREATVLEQAQKIVVLSMYITANLDTVLASRIDVFAHRRGALTFMGASSSRRMGCEMKISRALVQRYRISVSNNCTCLPGLLPRTSSSLSMMESKSTSFSAIAVTCYWLGCGDGRACGRGRTSRGWGRGLTREVVVLCSLWLRVRRAVVKKKRWVAAENRSPAAVQARTQRRRLVGTGTCPDAAAVNGVRNVPLG
jgi:hypothetical protein